MAKSTMVTKWTADTSGYDANIAKAKRQLEGFTQENLTAGGALKQLTGGLVSTAAKFASLGAVAAGAMKTLKDAFMASEANVDEWGRTMASAQSMYEGFLMALNTGDVSGFLGRIDQIVTAARRAYDELDKLGSLKTIQAPEISAQQAENQRMQAMLRTGRYIAPAAGSGMAAKGENGRLLTPQELKTIERHLQNGMDNLVRLTGNEVKQTGEAISAVYDRFSKELGMTEKEFRAGTASWSEFTRRMSGADLYRQWESQHTQSVGGTVQMNMRSGGENPYQAYAGWADFRVDGKRYAELVQLIQQRDQQAAGMYGQQASAYRTINRVEGITPKGLMKGAGGGGKSETEKMLESGMQGLTVFDGITIRTTESMKQLQAEMARYRDMLMNATNSAEYGTAQAGIAQTQRKMDVQDVALRAGISTDAWIRLEDDMRAKLQELSDNIQPIEVQVTAAKGSAKIGKETADAWNSAAAAVSNVGSALMGLEDPSAKIAGIVGQAIANIALGFAQATASPATGAAGVFGWIAAATAGLATMTATIASIKSATAGNFAGGGVVPGNDWTGDNMRVYGLNSGELILNKSQQSNIASQLSAGEGGGAGGNGQPYVDGERIFLGLNNYLKRNGWGEIVTSRRWCR